MEAEVDQDRPLLDKSVISALLLEVFLDLLAEFLTPNSFVLQIDVVNENLVEIKVVVLVVINCESVLVLCYNDLFIC